MTRIAVQALSASSTRVEETAPRLFQRLERNCGYSIGNLDVIEREKTEIIHSYRLFKQPIPALQALHNYFAFLNFVIRNNSEKDPELLFLQKKVAQEITCMERQHFNLQEVESLTEEIRRVLAAKECELNPLEEVSKETEGVNIGSSKPQVVQESLMERICKLISKILSFFYQRVA